jgi:hypothetical protein
MVDLLADGGARRASSGTTEQCAQQTSGQSAQDRTDWASD